MIKNKGKILLTTLLVLLFVTLFATMALALEGENITITFYTSGNTIDKTYGDEGHVSLVGGGKYVLPTKEVEEGQSFSWYTADGQAWEGGTEVTFYENTSLYPITAVDVYTYDELNFWVGDGGSKGKGGCKVRLMADIEITKNLGFAGGETGYESFFILNGHKITIASNLDKGWGGSRHGSHFYGTGTIEYLGKGRFIDLNNHGWGGSHCKLFIGKGVTINAPDAVLARDGDGSITQGYPEITVYGTAICKTVLKMDNGNNRNPKIIVHDGGQLILNGDLVWNNAVGNTIHVTVDGGTIYCNAEKSNFFNDSSTDYVITGGSFIFATQADKEKLYSTIDVTRSRIGEIVANNNVTYNVVSTNKCAHEYAYTTSLSPSCINGTVDVYRCTKCNDEIRISYGDMIAHVIPSEPVETQQPTKTERGWKKYVCSCCSCVKYEYLHYDATNDEILVFVDTGSGKIEESTYVKDVYIVENGCITGVKAFGSYTLDQIVGIYIPVGINSVNITTKYDSVKEIILGQYIDAQIISLTGLTSLESIEVETVTALNFSANCAPVSLKSIVFTDTSTAVFGEIEFSENAFLDKANLETLTLTPNASFIFGKNSFKQTGLKSLYLPDNSTIEFKGEAAFYGSKIEKLYVGKGIKEIKNKPFDNAYYLREVVLMDVTSISDNDFSYLCKNDANNIPVVYHHASSLSIGNNTFKNSNGIVLYTKASITNGFAGCTKKTVNGVEYPTFTIHYGITHAYDKTETASTCLVNGTIVYTTSCPCGINEGTVHKVFEGVYTNSSISTREDYTDKIKEKLDHKFGDVVGVDYIKGYTSPGYGIKLCSMCNQKLAEDTPSCQPLVRCLGYSVSTSGDSNAITVKYVVDSEAIEQYKNVNGDDVKYGLVLAAKSTLQEDETPLDENGNPRNSVIKYQASDYGYTSVQVKLSNISQTQQNAHYVMCAYIEDDGKHYYIQDNETVDNPSGVSYAEIKELADFMESQAQAR